MKNFAILLFALTLGISQNSLAAEQDCGSMEVWDPQTGMCLPLAMPGMPMSMAMLHGNAFFAQDHTDGPRGRDRFIVPDMFMADLGTSLGDIQYLNLDFMGTVERWTYPQDGAPELLQIGEANQDHVPFLDAQHPHSSPVMGLTFSDTISLGQEKDFLKFWLAPRGSSTDGPIAFMHRPTGLVNPDAPLGHHIGQDVGHISSSVIGAAWHFGNALIEVSTFNGREPEPSKVDLPILTPDSQALRLSYQFTPKILAMVSAAVVNHPEPEDPSLERLWRYSASIYVDHSFENGWKLSDALIWGLINNYDGTSALNSFAEEFWLHRDAHSFWGRLEELQRTAGELEILTAPDSTTPHWVTALTLGFTERIWHDDSAQMGLGASLTADLLPAAFQDAYGSGPAFSGKIFLQVSGMKMWDL